jgi:modulator of FtsH protease
MEYEGQILARSHRKTNVLAANKVIRHTYLLLSLTLLFSAITAFFSMITYAQPNVLLLIAGMFGLYFWVIAARRSKWGILAIFVYTGFMGYMLGPVLNFYLASYVNGFQLIMAALGSTGVIFAGLSAYALVTRKDFSYLGGFIAVACITAFIAGLIAAFTHMPMLQLLVAFAFALISSGYILFMTSQIVNGGERNYIIATITLYIAFFNLFVSLLRIFAAFAGNSRR